LNQIAALDSFLPRFFDQRSVPIAWKSL